MGGAGRWTGEKYEFGCAGRREDDGFGRAGWREEDERWWDTGGEAGGEAPEGGGVEYDGGGNDLGARHK